MVNKIERVVGDIVTSTPRALKSLAGIPSNIHKTTKYYRKNIYYKITNNNNKTYNNNSKTYYDNSKRINNNLRAQGLFGSLIFVVGMLLKYVIIVSYYSIKVLYFCIVFIVLGFIEMFTSPFKNMNKKDKGFTCE